MIGQKIGRYRVLDRVGRGGMGTVYRAIDETLQREVAIKALHAGLDDPEIGRRFRAEAVTVARLDHPGLVRIFELFEHDDRWLMVMEFVQGETLEQVIARDGAMPVKRASAIGMQCLAALAHAHGMGVVHRDLKPANIMLTAGDVPRVMDFGIARAVDSERITHVGFMMGTPAYMAPEQVLGDEVDARADLYAMGVVLYRMVTGHLPFTGETPFAVAQAQVQAPPPSLRSLSPDVPDWFSTVIDRALSKSPGERFQTAGAFREALEAGPRRAPATDAAGAAAPTGTPDRVAASSRPGRIDGRGLIAGAAIVVVLLGTGWMLWPGDSAPPAEPAAAAPGADTPVAVPPDARSEVATSSPEPPAASSPRGGGAATAGGNPPGPRTTAGASGPPAPAPAPIAAPPPVEVPRVRIMVLDGRRAEPVDATLTFGSDRLDASPDGNDGSIASWTYGEIAGATYVHARNPRWNTELAGPPDDLDVGGFFRPSRHWLTLQSDRDFVILRLEDINVIRVIRELEARTGLAIRNPEGERE